MVALIVACEIGFWVLIALGLTARYPLKARRLGAALLLAVPGVDVVLLVATVLDLRSGSPADATHGLTAVYLGVSIAFGRQLLGWADGKFAHRFAGGPAPAPPPRTGRAHAARERRQWGRHLLAYGIAVVLLLGCTALIGDVTRARPLWSPMAPWAVVLVIDFVISFSYTLAPRRSAGGDPGDGATRQAASSRGRSAARTPGRSASGSRPSPRR
jgi:hypothetical protein